LEIIWYSLRTSSVAGFIVFTFLSSFKDLSPLYSTKNFPVKP
jgi:hypothetical protein